MEMPRSFKQATKAKFLVPGGVGAVAGTAFAAGGSNLAKRYSGGVGGRFLGPVVGVAGGLGAAALTYAIANARGVKGNRRVHDAAMYAAGITAASTVGFGAYELLTGQNPISGVGTAVARLPRAVTGGAFVPQRVFQGGGTGILPLRTFQGGGVHRGPLLMRKNLAVA